MIPAEAVEAAALALLVHLPVQSFDQGCDLPCTSNSDELDTHLARIALEAAAPHMLADTWDEGRKHGATYPYGQRKVAADDNPYRYIGGTA